MFYKVCGNCYVDLTKIDNMLVQPPNKMTNSLPVLLIKTENDKIEIRKETVEELVTLMEEIVAASKS